MHIPQPLHLWAHWAASAFAVAGAVILRHRRESILPTLAMVGLALWTAAFTFGITRYRIGADVAVIVLAAVTVGHLLDRLRPEPEPTRGPSREAVGTT